MSDRTSTAPPPHPDDTLSCWLAREIAGPGGVGAHHYLEWEFASFDVERFRSAWRRLIERHEALRTVVRPDGRTEVRETPPGDAGVLDLRALEPIAAENEALAQRERRSRHTPAGAEALVTLLPGDRARLHLTIDRLAADPWTLAHVLLPDLAALHGAPGGGPGGPAPPVPRPPEVTDEDRAASRRYWLARAAELPPPPDLPAAGARDSGEPGRLRRLSHRTPGAWPRLTGTAGGRDVPARHVPVAAFAEVLRTWSRAGRFTLAHAHHDGGGAVPSPLAIDAPDATFEERARAIAARVSADFDHRHFNGVRVLRELNRGRGGGLVFPVAFTDLLDRPLPRGLGRPVAALSPDSRTRLGVQVWRDDDGAIESAWEWRADLYPPGMVEAMFGAYRRLLDRLAGDGPEWTMEHIPLVPAEQLARRAEINATERPVPGGLLHTPVGAHARLRPGDPAVITSGRVLTYRELDSRTNQVGRRLRELGARPGQLVGVVMDKGWEQIVALHGVLASGAAYVPIDPAVPAERLALLLGDGDVETVLTQSRIDAALSWPDGVRRLRVDRDFDGLDDTPLKPAQRQTDLAYVIYTSGSTGVPKGVMVDHRGALNTLHDLNRRLGLGPGDRCLALSGIHFDLSVYDTFGITAAGGAVVVPDPAPRPDPGHWSALMESGRVTFLLAVPALVEMLVTHLELGGDAARIERLRNVVMAGDRLPLTLPDRIRALNPAARVFNSGGPAENCVLSVIYPIGDVDPAWTGIPLGRPMANQRYHILDERDRPRPDWVPGEIHIASEVGLALGYWRDETRTRERFRAVPGLGERVYASGDIGRHTPGGDFDILGREDFQVKIQGVRIELGEIESVLVEHPGVRAAAVVADRTIPDLPVLRAHIVAAEGRAAPPPDELRAHLARKLPSSMVPASITALDRLPLTANGKVDRLALARGRGSGTRDAESVEPATALERTVCAICAELLGIARVGMNDDFLRLGGDSALMVRLAARFREAFAVELAVPALYTAPALKDICAAVAAAVPAGLP